MENLGDKYRGNNPFTVPEGYFERLTERVMDHIDEEKKKPKYTGLMRTLKPYFGLAALFVLAMFVVQTILPHFIDNSRMIDQGHTTEVSQGTDQEDAREATEKDVELDSRFNPSNEEIMEYLSTEMNQYDLIYAELY